ncbi:MAG: hypothetical protein R3B72_39045 [Polyangiaceae bacterium]
MERQRRKCAPRTSPAPPFIAMDGEPGYSHPVSVQLVGSHPVRVVASFDSDEDAPVKPPYLRPRFVNLDPWEAWPPTPSEVLVVGVGARGLRVAATSVGFSAAASAPVVGLQYLADAHQTDKATQSTEVGPPAVRVLAISAHEDRALVHAARDDGAMAYLVEGPLLSAGYPMGCAGEAPAGDAWRASDGWWIATTVAAPSTGCGGEPRALSLAFLSDAGELTEGNVMTLSQGFGWVHQVEHAGRRWVIFSSPDNGSLWAAPQDGHALGEPVALHSVIDLETDFSVVPFESGVAVAYHDPKVGMVVRIIGALTVPDESIVIDLHEPGPLLDAPSLTVAPEGLLVAWTASVPVEGFDEPQSRPLVARIGCP